MKVIMALSHLVRIDQSTGGLEYIHCRVTAFLCDLTAKHYLTIQMLHNGLNRRIRDIIGWNVDRLERSDGTLGVGVDALLDLCDIRIQSCRITILDGIRFSLALISE